MSDNFLFENWAGIWRIILVAPLAYVALIFMLRVSGNRTLSKMSAFDLIITIALGSILATVILSKDIVLAEGLLAFLLLIMLQFTVTWFSSRFHGIGRLLHAEPVLLLRNGNFLPGAMRVARVSRAEIHQALRNAGIDKLADAQEVFLETNGEFTVIPRE